MPASKDVTTRTPVPQDPPPDAPPQALTRAERIPPIALASREVAGPGPWFDPLKCPELRGPSSPGSGEFSQPPRPCGPIPARLDPEIRDRENAAAYARQQQRKNIEATALAAVEKALASEKTGDAA